MLAQTVRKGDLAQRLEIGRQSVTEYSNAIGQMRTIRDTLVRDIEALQLDYSVAAPTTRCSLRTALASCAPLVHKCACVLCVTLETLRGTAPVQGDEDGAQLEEPHGRFARNQYPFSARTSRALQLLLSLLIAQVLQEISL